MPHYTSMPRTRLAFTAILSLVMLMLPAIGQAQDKPQATSTASTLTDSQKHALQQALQAAENDGKAKVAPLMLKLGAITKSIDRNLLSDKPDQELDRKLTRDLVAAVSEVVATAIDLKLSAGREIVKLLTPEQRKILLAEIEKPDSNPDLTELAGKVFGDKKK